MRAALPCLTWHLFVACYSIMTLPPPHTFCPLPWSACVGRGLRQREAAPHDGRPHRAGGQNVCLAPARTNRTSGPLSPNGFEVRPQGHSGSVRHACAGAGAQYLPGRMHKCCDGFSPAHRPSTCPGHVPAICCGGPRSWWADRAQTRTEARVDTLGLGCPAARAREGTENPLNARADIYSLRHTVAAVSVCMTLGASLGHHHLDELLIVNLRGRACQPGQYGQRVGTLGSGRPAWAAGDSPVRRRRCQPRESSRQPPRPSASRPGWSSRGAAAGPWVGESAGERALRGGREPPSRGP